MRRMERASPLLSSMAAALPIEALAFRLVKLPSLTLTRISASSFGDCEEAEAAEWAEQDFSSIAALWFKFKNMPAELPGAPTLPS